MCVTYCFLTGTLLESIQYCQNLQRTTQSGQLIHNSLTSDSLLSLREAADILGVSRSTLRRWAKQGDIAYFRISTRGDIRISREILSRFISDRLANSETDHN